MGSSPPSPSGMAVTSSLSVGAPPPPGEALAGKVPSSTSSMSFAVRVSCSSRAAASLWSCSWLVVSRVFTRSYASRSTRCTSLSTRPHSSLPEPPRPLPSSASTCIGPISSLIPQSATMCLAIRVACLRSEVAPDVTLSTPKMSSSATFPPIATSMLASICSRVMENSSLSGSCDTMPRAWPRGTMVALWMGLAPLVCIATSACPPSW
mmetsp:Transcript_14155/g.40123  ORF Transcript_14155/g.40123 Transcript_14155/m.40123 type:complete len:208 (-) Transcript_14155:257-880(-)